MKKLLIVLLCVTMLAACSSPAGAPMSPSPSAVSASASPTASASAVGTVYPSCSPAPMLVPSTNIPHVETGGAELAANPDVSVYEDDKYIYCADSKFYCISKATNKVNEVSGKCMLGVTLCNGKAYYVDYVDSGAAGIEKETVMRYDPQSGKAEEVFSVNSMINDMTIYKDMVYITYAADQSDSKSAVGLYAVNLNGGGSKLIKKNVDTFCIYKDAIYYTVPSASGLWDRTSLYKCGLDGSGNTKFLDNVYPDIQISNGKLYSSYSDTVTDLDTGTSTPVSMTDNDGGFAFLGNYLLYITGNYGEIDPKLLAFNVNTGETYYLIDLGDYNAYMLSSVSGSAYVGLIDENGTHLSRVTIKGGMASISEVLYIADNSADEYGDDEYGDDEGDEGDGDYEDTEPAALDYKTPAKDTVIIADCGGGIYGGYSGGKWLTNKEAAEYCGGNLMFYGYNLTGVVDSAESTEVTYDDSDDRVSSSVSGGSSEEGGYYSLDASLDYEEGSLPVYLYNVSPKKLPAITVVADTSALLPAVQQLIDAQLGADAAAAQIRTAVSADIDGDGAQETIVNADNCADKVYEAGGENFYSIACIIESDGSVCVIDDRYLAKNSSEDFSDVEYVYTQNIIDLNSDGKCEIVVSWEAWEADGVTVYTYDGQSFKDVLSYDTWV